MTHAFDLQAALPGFRLDATADWSAPCTALFGASGSGKTTIIESIAGARPEVNGPITLNGRRIEALGARDRGVGWVPQDAALFPHLTAGENVAFGARWRGDPGAGEAAMEALELAPVRERPARDLSGGERQRVAIARALASRPSFLLLDEPLASLDRPLRARVLPYLARIPEQLGVPMLLVTHDPLEVLALASWVLVIEGGRVVESGDPRSVFVSAATFGPLRTLGAENVFDVAPGPARGPAAGVLEVTTRGGCVLEIAAVAGFAAPARVAIRSEDILLATDEPRGISAQNVLAATIEIIEPLGSHAHVVARASGEVFRAKITGRALAALGLETGRRVYLIIKAHAVHPCQPATAG